MTTVLIRYDGVNITNDVLFRSANFESQLAATPGMFEFTVKDVNQTHSFDTGLEVTLDLDGVRHWGGYVTQVEAFYATLVDTSVPANVEVRQWRLRGVDYNILFDKRVLANYATPKAALPYFAPGTQDGTAITTLCNTYLQLAGDGISLAGVTNVDTLTPSGAQGAYGAPGDKWRQTMDRFGGTTGAIWYISPSKVLINKDREDDAVTWGFSDVPNGTTTFGPRAIRYTVEGSSVVNDAFVWGGSPIGSGGTVTFGRATNMTSVNAGLRMQYAEKRFNTIGYTTDGSCLNRANIVVHGEPGTVVIPGDGEDANRGLQYPQRLLSLTWFHGTVPSSLVPGQVVTTTLYTFGTPGFPLTLTLPLRSVRISFVTPTQPVLEGSFGIQTTDPFSLWSYMKSVADSVEAPTQVVSGTTWMSDDATVPLAGAWFAGAMSPAPDDAQTAFTLRFGYVAATTRVYVNGELQARGTQYTETNPATGQITFTLPPQWGSILYGIAQASGT